MYISADFLCIADVAARFAANPALAKTHAPRASFSCTQAKTPVEKSICSDSDLGRADIVLSRVYDSRLKSAKDADKIVLQKNERQWLNALPARCGFSNVPASQKALNCLRISFELRFRSLDTCGVGDDFADCMASDGYDKPVDAGGAAPAASIDCEAPATTMETAICADYNLGQSDVWLASVYHDADKALGTAHHGDLVDSERKWLHFANQSCTFDSISSSPSALTRACVYDALNARAEQVKKCMKEEPQKQVPCLNEFRLFVKE